MSTTKHTYQFNVRPTSRHLIVDVRLLILFPSETRFLIDHLQLSENNTRGYRDG